MGWRAVFAALQTCGLAIVVTTAPPVQAGEIDQQLFGKEPGQSRAAACFARHYDAAHLKSHPQQNVSDMVVLISNEMGSDYIAHQVSLGVKFRGLSTQMQASGYCGSIEAGEESLHCGIECDGGTIGVRLQNADTILVDLPDGAAVWDPNADLTEDVEQPPEAQFGADDKTFRLTRTALDQCVELAYDDELKSLLAAK